MAHALVKRIASAAQVLGTSRMAKRHQMSLLLTDSDPNNLLRDQGSLRFYSNDELRKRADIRHAPEVLRLLEQWWVGAKHTIDDDDGDSSTLNKQEYAAFYWRLVAAFNDDEDDENDISEEESRLALEADWANDSRGDNYVDREEFFDSVFELADQWCETSTLQEYVEFLSKLYAKMFRAAEHWRGVRAARLIVHKDGHRFDVNKFKSFDMSTYLAKLQSVAHLGIGGALAWRRASVSAGAGPGAEFGKGAGAQQSAASVSGIGAGEGAWGGGTRVSAGPGAGGSGGGGGGLRGGRERGPAAFVEDGAANRDLQDSYARSGGASAGSGGAQGEQQLALRRGQGVGGVDPDRGRAGNSTGPGGDAAFPTGGRMAVDVRVYDADGASPGHEGGAPPSSQDDPLASSSARAYARSSLFASPSGRPSVDGGSTVSGFVHVPGGDAIDVTALMRTALGRGKHMIGSGEGSFGSGRNSDSGGRSSDSVHFGAGAIAYVSGATEAGSRDANSGSGKTGAMRHWGRVDPANVLFSRSAGGVTRSRPPGPHTLVRQMLHQSGQLHANVAAKGSDALGSPTVGGASLTSATGSSIGSGGGRSVPPLQPLDERASPGGGKDPGRVRHVSRGHRRSGLSVNRRGSPSPKATSRMQMQTRSLALDSASGMLVVSPLVGHPGSRSFRMEHPRRFHLVCEGSDPTENRYFPSKTGLASGNWATAGST